MMMFPVRIGVEEAVLEDHLITMPTLCLAIVLPEAPASTAA